MRKVLWPIVVVVGILFSIEAGARTDFQYWNINEIEWKARENWSLSVSEELRFGGNVSRLYSHRTDIGLKYSGITDWLDIKAGYRQVFDRVGNRWKYENVPHFDGTLGMGLGGFKFSTRNRIEYRNREDRRNDWRYRNRLTAKRPFFFGTFEFAPYISDEIYLDCSKVGRILRNRLSAGTEVKLLRYLVCDVYYMRQSTRGRSGWVDINVIGTKLKLAF